MRKWKEKEFPVHSNCSAVSKWRDVESLLLPQCWSPFLCIPSTALQSCPLTAVFVEGCTMPLTCHHFASLGPLAADPGICTWEAEGVLRSPNQPSFLKVWATSNKGWRRAERGSKALRRGAVLWRVGEGPGDWGRPGGGGVVRPEAEDGKGWLLFPEGVMGMMQTEPRSKSLAAT